MDPNSFPINSELLRSLWTVYTTDGTVQACRNVIATRLLSGGIVFSSGGHKPGAEFDRHVEKEFVPFAIEVMDSLLVQGFAAYVVDTKHNTPHCIPRGMASYSVTVSRSYVRRMVVYTLHGDIERRARCLVENWPSNDAIHSPVAAFRRSHAFRGMVELNTAVADYTAARPLVYTSTDSDKAFDRRHVYRNALDASMDARSMLASNSYVNPETETGVEDVHRQATALLVGLGEANRARYAEHGSMLQMAADQKQRLAADLNSGRIDPRTVRIDPTNGLPVFDSSIMRGANDQYNVIPLPIDAKVQAQIAPTSRRDLVSNSKIICR